MLALSGNTTDVHVAVKLYRLATRCESESLAHSVS